MWLVLCSPIDAAAHWAYEGLAARGVSPIRLLYPEALTEWCRWEHRLGAGGCGARIILADGCELESGTVCGVLNRLVTVSPSPLSSASDYSYVIQELRALLLSWLNGLPAPVINRASPSGLSGACRHISEWLPLAARAGLPTAAYRQSSADAVPEMYGERPLFPPGTPMRTVVVLGAAAFGKAPAEIADSCVRLAEIAGLTLLGVDFVVGAEGRWQFAGATPSPDLRLGRAPLLDQLALRLRAEVAA
jgi:hypothetical protein